MNDPIGRILLPASGTPVTGFDFLISPDQVVNVAVGQVVTATTLDGEVVGVITNASTIGMDNDPVLAANLVPDEAAPLVDQTKHAVVASVQTFYSKALRPVRGGAVYTATSETVKSLCQYDRLERPMVSGVIELASGQYAPVYIDTDELLGPLAAHLIVGGRSGAAAKTSYACVLLASALASGAVHDVPTAALLFNVKGPDLLTLDMPTQDLSETDKKLYQAWGLEPEPFKHVSVYAPAISGGSGTRSKREDAIGIQWSLRDFWGYLQYLDGRFGDNDNSYALVADLDANVVQRQNVNSLGELCAFLETKINEAENENRSDIWNGHHIATARKILRALNSLPSVTKGLIPKERVRSGLHDVPSHFAAGEVVVVDVADLEPRVQAAVIARTCSKILKSVGNEGIGVERLVIFADELNVFAPASVGDVPRQVREVLSKVTATGRYAGISLWGAAQFPSAIHGQIRDNASTLAVGAIAETELDSGVYGKLTSGVREQMVTATRGTMLIRAANLRSWTPVLFPRPAWSTGQARQSTVLRTRPKDTSILNLNDKGLTNLTEGIDPETVDDVIAKYDGDVDKITKALESIREPDMHRISPEPASSYDPSDPWASI